MKLVEAEQPRLLGERGGGQSDRIVIGDLAGLDLLTIDVHALVHVCHELMEVHTPFALHRARGEEQIHQHGLAAPDVTVNVEASDRALLPLVLAEQPAKLRGLPRKPMLREPLFEPRESCGERFLRGIAFDLAIADQGGVTFGDG